MRNETVRKKVALWEAGRTRMSDIPIRILCPIWAMWMDMFLPTMVRWMPRCAPKGVHPAPPPPQFLVAHSLGRGVNLLHIPVSERKSFATEAHRQYTWNIRLSTTGSLFSPQLRPVQVPCFSILTFYEKLWQYLHSKCKAAHLLPSTISRLLDMALA